MLRGQFDISNPFFLNERFLANMLQCWGTYNWWIGEHLRFAPHVGTCFVVGNHGGVRCQYQWTNAAGGNTAWAKKVRQFRDEPDGLERGSQNVGQS